MTRFKLLVTDLDGTLLDSSGQVHESDLRAVIELQQRGIHVTVCTGRMYSGTRDIAREIGVTGAVGCLDGSQVVDCSDDTALTTHPILAEAAEPLIEAIEEFDPITFVFSQDSVLHDQRGVPFLPFVGLWSKRSVHLKRVLDPAHFQDDRSVAALVSLGDEGQIRAAAQRIFELAGNHIQIGFFAVARRDLDANWGMVVRAAGVSKATALSSIAEHYGVTVEETVAVGDWINDISMLAAAGRSYAMGQAPDEVKAAATETLEADAWSGGGIEEAARRAGML
ncbi:MAG: HAD family hydrolase [Myxococcales bacterium]|nr:HAD family hydrolase [Myxococcales bacterium]